MVSSALAGIAGIKTQVAMCIQDRGLATDCSANANGIAPDLVADDINYVVSTTTVDGQITLVTEGVADDASTNMQLVITAVPVGAALRWTYDQTQNGCRDVTPTRGIDCSN